MGFLSGAWNLVKSAGKTVFNIAKKAYQFCTGDSAVSEYEKLRELLETNKSIAATDAQSRPVYPFNFLGDIPDTTTTSDDTKSKKINALQIEYVRLRSSAELIDRSLKNIKIHASSLSVHYESMKNITSLIEQGNKVNILLEQIVTTVNKNAELGGNNDCEFHRINFEKEENIGDISQLAAFDAFDRTRELLTEEIFELSEIATKHLEDLDIFKMKWVKYGGEYDDQVISFINTKIIPIIKNAEYAGMILKDDVLQLPIASREEDGLIKI